MQAMLAELKAGDKVVTSGGIYGTINGIDGDSVILKISSEPQVKIRISACGDCSGGGIGRCKISPPFAARAFYFLTMNPNLKWKALFILAVILFCIYFLFGYPVFPPRSRR